MTVLTKRREAVLEHLTRFAGSPLIVEQAMRDLNAESATPPTVETVIRRILEIREQAAASRKALTV